MDGKIFRITAIKAQARNRRRVNIYLESGYDFSLDKFVAAWLKVGDELSEEKISQLIQKDEHEKAYQAALRFLNFRPRSEMEMTAHLEKRGLAADVIAEIIERLKDNHLIDDVAFAERWIESRAHSRNCSRRGLIQELKQHGIAAQIVESALESTYGDEHEIAMRAAIKVARKLHLKDWQDFRKKMITRLLYRQFSYDMALDVTKRIWEEIQEERVTEEVIK